jgi:hypothetical protein
MRDLDSSDYKIFRSMKEKLKRAVMEYENRLPMEWNPLVKQQKKMRQRRMLTSQLS